MPGEPITPAERAAGLLAGYLAGAAELGGTDASALAFRMAGMLADELLVPEPAVDRLARRWADEGASSPLLDEGTAVGLAWLQHTGMPRTAAQPGELPTWPVLLPPVAILTFDSPRNLLSASFHLAGLTHPAPESQWGAVAVNVALARLLQGFRDIVPDVIEALRNNEAPATLLEPARRLPLLTRGEVVSLARSGPPAAAATIASIWLAHHEPKADRGMGWLAEVPELRPALPAAGAMFGARGGVSALSETRVARGGPSGDIRALAVRLARIPTTSGTS